MANNFQSIFGSIVRGLSNDRRSAGLTGSNVKTDNPQTYAYIGQESSDLRQPIQREQTQNPSLQFGKASGGTEYAYTNPLPTDIRSLITQAYPGTSVTPRDKASSVGSSTLVPPSVAPMNNWQVRGYGMSPQNGDHFKSFFANQMGLSNSSIVRPNPALVSDAISEQAEFAITGGANIWHNSWQTFLSMAKGYNPSGSYW